MSEGQTVSFEEHSKAVQKAQDMEARAQRFEAQLADVQKKFDGLKDIDPEKYKATLEELNIMKREKAEKGDKKDLEAWEKETTEKITGKIRGETQKTIDDLTATCERLKAENYELKVVDKGMSLIGGYFNDDMQEDARMYVKKHMHLGDNGEWLIKDEKGNQLFEPGSANKPMTPEGFALWLREIKPSMFRATIKGGTKDAREQNGARFLPSTAEQYAKANPDQRKQMGVKDRADAAAHVMQGMPLSMLQNR